MFLMCNYFDNKYRHGKSLRTLACKHVIVNLYSQKHTLAIQRLSLVIIIMYSCIIINNGFVYLMSTNMFSANTSLVKYIVLL